jgi:hypothetical protein
MGFAVPPKVEFAVTIGDEALRVAWYRILFLNML